MKSPSFLILLCLCVATPHITRGAEDNSAAEPHPDETTPMNVLFIPVDDLNAWVGYTKHYPDIKTPNLDRLAAMGVAFTNAHCTAPACEPSRASLMSGLRPSTSGCYMNGDTWKEFIPEGISLNAHFKDNGYHVAAMGKLYHSSSGGLDKVYAAEFDEYPPTKSKNSAGRGPEKYEGYHEPLPLDLKDDDLPDWHTVDYCIEKLQEERDEPLFLTCGLIKPHLPWAVPKKYYQMFPRENIQLPPHREDDLDDIPEAGLKMAKPDADHAKFLESGRWKDAVQSYLATIAYVDMNVGRLLDALEESPHKDNTIIVLWGDHGWHLGEKQHWRKFALWEEATRAPLIFVAPGVTEPGGICDRPVDFSAIYPTLCDLAGLESPKHLDGVSLRPLLENPNAEWPGVAITTHGYQNHAVRDQNWRYIRYADGSEELYDHRSDPNEFTNLVNDPSKQKIKNRLAHHLPDTHTKPPPPPQKKK
ncbi:MAG: sulfatase [Verrucomicrobiota bacterium]